MGNFHTPQAKTSSPSTSHWKLKDRNGKTMDGNPPNKDAAGKNREYTVKIVITRVG